MRLLVVVSANYGELGHAMYFLNQVCISPRPLVLVPDAMSQHGIVDAALEIRIYASFADIRRAVDEAAPDTVLLFSGYLLSIGSRFSLLNVLSLIHLLRKRRVRMVTSDPFVGVLRSPFSLHFYDIAKSRRNSRGALPPWIMGRMISLRMYIMHVVLRRECHIYPAPIAGKYREPDRRRFCYFNGTDTMSVQCIAKRRNTHALWLFVLPRGELDFLTRSGDEGFAKYVAMRLEDAVDLGRRVMFIGPSELLPRSPEGEARHPGIEQHEVLSYPDYMRCLTEAEYVFYWNRYSFSVLHRIIACRPVFFFAAGHLETMLGAQRNVAIETYYNGWKPPLLNIRNPLDEKNLEQLAGETVENFRCIRAKLNTGLSPRGVLGV